MWAPVECLDKHAAPALFSRIEIALLSLLVQSGVVQWASPRLALLGRPEFILFPSCVAPLLVSYGSCPNFITSSLAFCSPLPSGVSPVAKLLSVRLV